MSLIHTLISKPKVFDSEDKCVAYLEQVRWPDGVRCPSCRSDKISRIRAKRKSGKVRPLYQCLERSCRYQFSATTGTIFHDSHLPLQTWFEAISIVAKSKDEVSVNQLRLRLGIQYKTAQRMVECIEEAMEEREPVEQTPKRISYAGAPRMQIPIVRPAAGLLQNASGMILGKGVNVATSMAKMAIRSPFNIARYMISTASPRKSSKRSE